MAERPRITPASPIPITPKKRGGVLQNLLAMFASQSSAEAATKTRRVSSQESKREDPIVSRDGENKSERHSLPRLDYGLAEDSTADCDEHSASISSPENEPTTTTISVPKGSRARRSKRTREEEGAISEDELALSARPARKSSSRIEAYTQELKMEKRKKERESTGSLRRSTRDRTSTILESDTVPTPSPTRKGRTPLRKLDTARTRLRDDIAHKSKTKANNFLVANKDYFLPLLPPHNHVSKLVAHHNAKPIVEYEELSEQPAGVTAVMKPYQLSGLSYLVHLYNNGFSGILGDEMGLGKTLQTLSLFQYLEELDQKNGLSSEELRPYLVICPLSVLNSWVTEAQRWVPGLRVMRFHGATSERQRLKRVAVGMEDMKGHETTRARDRKASRKAGRKVSKLSTNDQDSTSFKIIVTTYDTFQAEQAWFKHAFVWRYVVLDEGHKIKSSVTQISTALRTISAEYRLILTGTPLQNNLVEMWALLAWLYPDVFIGGTDKLFKESFDLNKGKVNRTTMDNARHLLELIMLRRMKDSPSVNLGLPPKEEVLLYVPLTPMQKFWYTRILTRIDNGMLDELFADGKTKEKAAIEQDMQEDQLLRRIEKQGMDADAKQGGEWEETANIMLEAIAKDQSSAQTKGAWQKLMNLVMQLRKCCSHPYLLPGAAPDPYYISNHIIRASGKFILLEKLLKHTIFDQGKKVLIFSGFTRTLDYCEDLLSLISNHGERFRSLRLDGSTARARRNLDIRLFNQKESDYKVMLLSTRAGGLGINLTSAQDVIFLDEDWNPQITLQAEARAHRIGQTNKVTIYKLCTQGTVEEQMMGRIRKKLYLSAKITESMQNIHGKETLAKTKGRASLTDDMPQMDTSQLKTLVRRGAQTLSHPEIDVNEMVSWDLETMMAKCRDKPADLTVAEGSHSEVDEEKWLSVMERVECAVFEGKRYQRQPNTRVNTNILPDTITREDRRKGKNTTVMIDGYAINKESLNCGDWEAVPTMAGKDPRLAEPVRDKRREFNHEEHCLACFEGSDTGHMVECRSCPRAYHFDCLEPEYQAKVKGFSGFYCSQHNCGDCGKNTTDAGGLIFRCRWCPQGFCEDCLDWDQTDLIGENLPEFELLHEPPTHGGFYIKCPTCIEACEESEEQKAWTKGMEIDYKEQHDLWLQQREETQREFEQREAAVAKLQEATAHHEASAAHTNKESMTADSQFPPRIALNKRPSYITIDDDDEIPSPPALTDTSLPTPALGGSRVSTPKYIEPQQNLNKGKKRTDPGEEGYGETREEKRARLDAQAWSVSEDPLMKGSGYTNGTRFD
ncbi:ISWI chromatin-remodeling complex ATPase ISW2 [Cucurbitaria berberidis CBS 394.84]|uniref:ISWI chromatin-remodeling complex ATPase ISW2 n=1 Tax=Cucurbitaria berberidis CBS 394.84 TaxID=1168544 RepID=A0A9P4G8X7_9PLEO|nr:ISWI chromatin-remodeling complex ATPase ISW2 [Cucurbitaria berberidis CBS 394.84]KAF1841232.1 ISWI chromatin-remodeling complex ATPase ISW2 [Cucurbitaria berberidis CBS 394.84]